MSFLECQRKRLFNFDCSDSLNTMMVHIPKSRVSSNAKPTKAPIAMLMTSLLICAFRSLFHRVRYLTRMMKGPKCLYVLFLCQHQTLLYLSPSSDE